MIPVVYILSKVIASKGSKFSVPFLCTCANLGCSVLKCVGCFFFFQFLMSFQIHCGKPSIYLIENILFLWHILSTNSTLISIPLFANRASLAVLRNLSLTLRLRNPGLSLVNKLCKKIVQKVKFTSRVIWVNHLK